MARKATVETRTSRRTKTAGSSSAGRAGEKVTVRRTRTRSSRGEESPSAGEKNTSTNNSSRQNERLYRTGRDAAAVICGILGVMLMLAAVSELIPQFGNFRIDNGFEEPNLKTRNVMGPLGQIVAETLVSVFGWTALLVIAMFIIFAYRLYSESREIIDRRKRFLRSVASLSFLCSFTTSIAILFGPSAGGGIGVGFANYLIKSLNDGGALLLAIAMVVVSAKLAFGLEVRASIAKSADRAKEIVTSSAENTRVAWSTGLGIIARIAQVSGQLSRTLMSAIMLPIRLFLKTLLVIWKILRFVTNHVQKSRVRASVAQTSVITLRSQDALLSPKARELTPKIVNNQRSQLALPSGGRTPEVKQPKQVAMPTRSGNKFVLPSLELLVGGTQEASLKQQDDELLRNSRLLEKALADFKIGGNIIEVQPGPVITLYQFEPAPGIKVQRIVSLADDLALALKVASVRVYAPVPGKGTVGIEVPNLHRETVRLREVLGSREYIESKAKLILALGKDTFGDPFVADLSKMPHLLIAGATGTGKSVCINSLILSLLFRNTPQDLRLLLIDPKMLELSVYEGIPHLKSPVITNPKRARGLLWWAVEEMERRFNLMKDLGVRNLASYNRAVAQGNRSARLSRGDLVEEEADLHDDSDSSNFDGEAPSSQTIARTIKNGGLTTLPRIVIVVDELADLMLTVGKEIEELLTRLAQKARAAGIHLILATQRPSVNVITGLIKANFPTRISFQVASRIDSRTVLDTSGSERLLGMGDMLYMSPGVGRLKRMHAAYVSDGEVQEVAEFLMSQGAPDYDEAIEEIINRFEESEKSAWGPGSGGAGGEEEYDALYDQAVQLVVEKGLASTSLVQRVFRIGYNRAARILETMEREGIVGPADGAKPRQVLLPNRMAEP